MRRWLSLVSLFMLAACNATPVVEPVANETPTPAALVVVVVTPVSPLPPSARTSARAAC